MFIIVFVNWRCYSISDKVNPQKNYFLEVKKINYFLDKCENFLFKPENYKIDIDSAKINLSRALSISKSINNQNLIYKCIFYYGEVSYEENNYPKAIERTSTAVKYFRKTKQFKKEAELWINLGEKYFWKSPRNIKSLEESIVYYNRALQIYKHLSLSEDSAYTIKLIADSHLNQGKLDLAEKELLHVLSIYNKIRYKKLHFTYDLLANLYRLKGNLGKYLYYSLECVKSMELNKDYLYAPAFYIQLAKSYKEFGKHKTCIELLKKAINIQRPRKDIDNNMLYYLTDFLCKELVEIKQYKEALTQAQNLIKDYPPKGKMENAVIAGTMALCYRKSNEPKLAEANYIKMIDLYEKNPELMSFAKLSNAYFELGKFYVEQKIYNKAKINFIKSQESPKGIIDQLQIKETNLYLFKIDSATGNYISAIKHFQKYKYLNDSIFDFNKTKQIEKIQMSYSFEKKKKELSNMKLSMELEKKKIVEANNKINIGIVVLVLLLTTTLLFATIYRLKQKNNQILISQKNEIDLKNSTLQKLVNEKEHLMQEIHHRVKNNLQIIMSLLNSQLSLLKNEDAFNAIQNSQQRLYAISLLHQKLYRTDEIVQIQMKNYINDLATNFKDTLDVYNRINFEMKVDSIDLDQSQAVSVGLILNEVITNSIKYAFPDNKMGSILVLMKLESNNKILLKISDNGIGFPEHFNFKESPSLGMNLINGLTEQLDGKLEFSNKNGANVKITFIQKPILDVTAG
ncbi:histidine kinase dimerization/phosphoacceptor domain -containing protein [Flavobacterium sp. 5]|uniref:tetratricopeptide repeat-containing sensor histidine kinase n=1 Tax=Flavobacterium sp. 5 TaxID=2035199 RepID=UPI0018E1EAA0|nr:histidine kinase dimerization/phosphoacceptor domain -containing protein [Flavobacterium sp. 5]